MGEGYEWFRGLCFGREMIGKGLKGIRYSLFLGVGDVSDYI